MNFLSKSIFILSVLFSYNLYGVSNSETYVTLVQDNPDWDYREGQTAIFEIYETSGWENKTEIEVFYQDNQTPLEITDLTTYKTVETPELEFGEVLLTFNVYEKPTQGEGLYVKKRFSGNLLESFEIVFNVKFNDFDPPVVSVTPEEESVFITDMPYMQVDYSDSPAGVDTQSFKAFIINDQNFRIEITDLFSVNEGFATIQFNETNKLPIGDFKLEVELSDVYENKTIKNWGFRVEISKPTEGFYIGKVLDSEKNPVEGASVFVQSGSSANFKKQAPVLTDIDGKYKLPVEQGGEVILTTTKEGWTSQSKNLLSESEKDLAVQDFIIKELDSNIVFIEKETGGVGTNEDGSLVFEVLPNSASNDIELNITKAYAGNELPGVLPQLTEFTHMGTMGPSGTTFNPSGILKIANEHDFPANTPIVVGYYNEETGLWEDSGNNAMVSEDAQSVIHELPHFSSWDANQPVVPPVDFQPSAEPTVSDSLNKGCEVKGCRINVDTGNLGVDYELPSIIRYGNEYKPVFTYFSQSSQPKLFAEAQQFFAYLPFGDLPDHIQVELSLGNIYRKVYYKAQGAIPSGDTVFSYQMLLDAKDANGHFMPTGVYDFEVSIGNDYKDSAFATALYFGAPPLTPLDSIAPEPVSLKYDIESRSIVLNSRNSAFGNGWTMQGLEKITVSTDNRVVWEDGSGKASLYTGIPVELSLKSRYLKEKNKDIKFSQNVVKALNRIDVTSVIENKGTFFVSSCRDNKIYAVSATGKVSVVAGTGKREFSGDNKRATEASLSCPTSLFATPKGEILIADSGNYRVRKINKRGFITTVAGNGVSQNEKKGHIEILKKHVLKNMEMGRKFDENKHGFLTKATDAGIGAPTFVSQDKLSTIHFITGNEIHAVDPRGNIQTLVAKEGGYYKASLNNPTQIAYDKRDNLIIVDSGNNRILKLFMQTGDLRVIAGSDKEILGEKVSKRRTQSVGKKLNTPISYLYENKTQTAYILDKEKDLYALTNDGRLVKTKYRSQVPNLLLTKMQGLVGLREFDKNQNKYRSLNVQGFISAPGDFSTLETYGEGYVRTTREGVKSYFNEEGLITSRVAPQGLTESFTYDAQNRVTQWTLPGGDFYTFTYAGLGRLEKVTDPSGKETYFTHNIRGHLTSIEDALGNEKTYAYNERDLLISETDENQNVHQYIYTNNDVLDKEIYPDQSIRDIKAKVGISLMSNIPEGEGTVDNPANIPIATEVFGEDVSQEGRVWEFDTDKFGKIIKSRDALKRVTEIDRNDLGLPVKIVNPNGGVMEYTYNQQGLPVTIYDNVYGSSFSYTEDFNKLSQITDELGRVTNLDYDTSGNLIKITDANLNETKFEYEGNGLLTKIIDANLNETTMSYNSKGLLESITDADNNTTTYTYTDSGLLETQTDALGRTTTYSYDNLNRLTSITDPISGVTSFTYSNTDKLLSITDAKNQTTSYTYNNRDQLISTTNALNQVEYYRYDKDNLLVEKTRRDGKKVSYVYDKAKQLTLIKTPDDEVVLNYDKSGNLSYIKNKSGKVVRSYDLRNQLISEIQNGYTLNYSYTATKELESVTTPTQFTQYLYNDLRQVTAIQSQMQKGTYNWSREYDNLQRPIKDTLPNGLEVIRSYNALSQLENISNQGGVNSNLLSQTAYVYDDIGKRIAKTQNQVQANYGYDNLDRLTSVSNPTETFSYDAVGNRDSWMHNEINQLLSDNYKYNFEYNLNGEMTKRTNLKTDEVTNYSWSARGELERITITDQTNQLKKEITFKYDGLGRRIEKMVVNTTSPEKSYTRKYFYDGQNIVEEKNASSQTVAAYLHTLGIDDPILMERNNEAYVYTKDGLGSIKELTKLDGKVTQRYRYSAYGEITRELLENRPNKDLVENSYTYTGREFEEETGLYYYRARYYDAELGRFISEDPIGFDGGVNFYNYVGASPVNFVDPLGLARICKRATSGKYYTNSVLDYFDLEIAHEHIFFEDDQGGDVGYFGDVLENVEDISDGYTCSDKKYDDAKLREAVDKAKKLKRYQDRKDYSSLTNNCQDFISDVLKGY